MDAKDTSDRSCEDILKYVQGRRSFESDDETASGPDYGSNTSRIFADLLEFRREAFSNIDVNPSEHSIYLWNITFPAPNGKTIKAKLKFDSKYPLVAPRMFIKQRIFHPNVSVTGEVCLQDLKDIWTPAHTIWSFILSVQCLLSDPNPHDPVNPLAAKMFCESPQEYQMYSWKCYEMLDEEWERVKNSPLTIDKPGSLTDQIKDSAKSKSVQVKSDEGENVEMGKIEKGSAEESIQFEEELLFQHMLEKSIVDYKIVQ